MCDVVDYNIEPVAEWISLLNGGIWYGTKSPVWHLALSWIDIFWKDIHISRIGVSNCIIDTTLSNSQTSCALYLLSSLAKTLLADSDLRWLIAWYPLSMINSNEYAAGSKNGRFTTSHKGVFDPWLAKPRFHWSRLVI